MFFYRIKTAVLSALAPATKTVVWILKLMIPLTLLVAFLNYFGVIASISRYAEPAFKLIGLSGDAVFVFLTSLLLNIYSAIAVMATIGFDYRSVTILAVMCLIAHNLIIETAIQRKSGASPLYIIILRIVAALIAGAVLNFVLPADMTGKLFFGSPEAVPTSLVEVFVLWAKSLWGLVVKMVFFIYGLNILQNILREFYVINALAYPLRPLMKILGLPRSTSFLWIVANCVGLTYGGALLVEECNNGFVLRRDSRLLNTHIAISHSLLEDTLLFFAIGIGVFWLLIPRILLAMVAVWGEKWLNKECRLGTIVKK